MLRAKPFEAAALGVSLLFAIAPITRADDDPPPAPRPATLETAPPRSAVERWQRLKAQYSTPSGARIEQPTRKNSASGTDVSIPNGGGDPATITALPASTDGGAGTAKVGTTLPGGPPATSTNAWKTLPPEPEPDWTRAVPAAPTNLKAEGLAPPVIAILPDQTNPQESSILPSPDRLVPQPATNSQVPTSPDSPNRGTPRPDVPLPVPSGPPRASTQVRPISDIVPLNDFDRDRDIRDYAAEKAREFNVRFGGEPYMPRDFPLVAEQWYAPQALYYPLYFQDAPLERYGHKYPFPIQPIVSNLRFGAQLLLLPYQMAITPPWELQTALGYYRPGDATPKLHYQFPWSTKAALVEAATVTGGYFLIP